MLLPYSKFCCEKPLRRRALFPRSVSKFTALVSKDPRFPWKASPRYKIRPLLTRHPRKNRFPRSFSLQEIFRLENRRFLFSLQQPETGADGQALRHFVLLYFCAIISSAGGVLSRVLLNFFSFEDLHEGFSPRSTRYNPPAARWPGLPFISNSSSIFGSPVCRSRQTAELFLHGRSFFRSAENKAPLLRASTPSPTGVVLTTSTDSWVAAALSLPWSSCSTHLLRRVLLSYSFRDQHKNLPWNDATPPTSSPPLTNLRVPVNLSSPPDINKQVFCKVS